MCGLRSLLDLPASLTWARPSEVNRVIELVEVHLEPEWAELGWSWSGRSPHTLASAKDCFFEQLRDKRTSSEPDEIDHVICKVGDDLPWALAAAWNRALDRFGSDPGRQETHLFSQWLLLATVVERRLFGQRNTPNQLDPLYWRALFLLLSVPFRSSRGGKAVAKCLKDYDLDDIGLSHLARTARDARRSWAHILDEATDLEFFESLDAAALDREIDLLVWDGESKKPGEKLLNLQAGADAASSVDDTLAQSGFLKWYCRRLLLPRFRLLDVYRVLRKLPVDGQPAPDQNDNVLLRSRRWAARELRDTPAPSLAVMAAIIVWSLVGLGFSLVGLGFNVGGPLLVMGDLTWTPSRLFVIGVAMVPYGAILLALWFRAGPAVTYPLALRFPAVATLGTSVLMALGTPWYAESHWGLVLVVTGFSLGYIRFEAANHRVSRPLRRAAGVLVLGYAHAFVVAVLWLGAGRDVFLAPIECAAQPRLAICQDNLDGWVAPAEALVQPGLVLANLCLTAAVGVMLGLAFQILWDDRPVTYPLTHLGGT